MKAARRLSRRSARLTAPTCSQRGGAWLFNLLLVLAAIGVGAGLYMRDLRLVEAGKGAHAAALAARSSGDLEAARAGQLLALENLTSVGDWTPNNAEALALEAAAMTELRELELEVLLAKDPLAAARARRGGARDAKLDKQLSIKLGRQALEQLERSGYGPLEAGWAELEASGGLSPELLARRKNAKLRAAARAAVAGLVEAANGARPELLAVLLTDRASVIGAYRSGFTGFAEELAQVEGRLDELTRLARVEDALARRHGQLDRWLAGVTRNELGRLAARAEFMGVEALEPVGALSVGLEAASAGLSERAATWARGYAGLKSLASEFADMALISSRPIDGGLELLFMDQRELSRGAFAAFVEAGGYTEGQRACWTDAGWRLRETRGLEAPKGWRDDEPAELRAKPITGLFYAEALAYASWAGKRVPSMAEWRLAFGSGASRRLFPWGQRWAEGKANFKRSESAPDLLPSGSFPEGRSPEGIDDLFGNAWEWLEPAEPGGKPRYVGGSFRYSAEDVADIDAKIAAGDHDRQELMKRLSRSASLVTYTDADLGARLVKTLRWDSAANARLRD